MAKLVIFGTGQTSDIVTHYLEHDSSHEIVGYTIDGDRVTNSLHNGKPLVAFERVRDFYPPEMCQMFVAVGYGDLNRLREEKYHSAKDLGYSLFSYVHSKAGPLYNIPIGENCFVLEHQSIQAFASIGNNCFIWSGALVAHHATVRDHCWITSGACIAGNTSIGERCFLGVNSTVGHMIEIGNDCLIGAGALVTRSTPDGTVFIEENTPIFKLNSRQFLRITKMQ